MAGAIGPLNKTLSLSPDVNNPGYRAVSFDEVAASYTEQIKGLVDVFERHGVGDEGIQRYLAFLCLVHVAGQFGAPLDAAKAAAAPDPAGAELEGRLQRKA